MNHNNRNSSYTNKGKVKVKFIQLMHEVGKTTEVVDSHVRNSD